MVGLRLKSGLEAEEGNCLAEELVPWAAALSDLLLSSHCAACFGPCSTACFPCPGLCQGALVYCSPSCRSLDLGLHSRSAECKLLSLLQYSASPVSSASFPSLCGTCDIRTALRLLAQHYDLTNVTHFLAASRGAHDVSHPRLGGLLSNRSSLLQTSPSGDDVEDEDEESCLAKELGEAARLMFHVRYAGSEYNPAAPMSACITESSYGARLSKNVERQDAYATDRKTQEDALPHVLECMESSRLLDFSQKEFMDDRQVLQESVYEAETNHYSAVSEQLGTNASAHAYTEVEKVDEYLCQADKMLLVQEVLCQVYTNGVRIQTDAWIVNGRLNVQSIDLGTAVYGPLLSWINHSCRPNTFFSFVLAGQVSSKNSHKASLGPDMDVKDLKDTWGLMSAFPWSERIDYRGPCCLQHYSPRVRLCAIRNIKSLEAVCISYIDLLQPKNMRRQELWLKYRFHCTCERCEMSPKEGVDDMLQKLGYYAGNQSDMLVLDNWLSKEAQYGFRELLENDNPSSCCEILEGALLKLMHHSCQSCSNAESPQCLPPQGGLNHEQDCLEACTKQRRRRKLHLMNHICLNIYMILSSSYKMLAIGFSNSGDEGPSICNSSTGFAQRREAECSISSAAYSLVQATMIQCLCDFGEPGLLATSARFWLQNWECCINLILKLDRYFHLDSMSEMQYLLATCISEFRLIVSLPDDNFICKLKNLFNMCEGLQNCNSTRQLLRFSATDLWPFLQSTSPFLSCIETPFDSEVCIVAGEKQVGLLESKDGWLCHRAEALICALCSLQQSFKLITVLYGSGHEPIEHMENFLSFSFAV
ncbi:hypothetical protein L7F22_049226 [Adiantum nelumboides]|nr:hypothetical protein [Adiantum nelumboides]